LAITTYQKPIDWHGKPVQLVIAIAVNNEDHMNILQNICTKLSNEQDVINLVKSKNIDEIYKVLTINNNEN
jgi:mannitol/fructose-specific phosphotransferase system IIA component